MSSAANCEEIVLLITYKIEGGCLSRKCMFMHAFSEDNSYEKELEWVEYACWIAGNAFMQRASQREALSLHQSGPG